MSSIIKSRVMRGFTAFTISMCMCLTSCTINGTKARSTTTALSANISDGSMQLRNNKMDISDITAQSKNDKKDTVVKEEKVVKSWEEFQASNLPLIAAIPERDIYLYGIKPRGVILYVEGSGHYFDWDYFTPRFILPQMYIGDFDHDKNEEVAVILYVASGTGISIEELHIVEISGNPILSKEPSSKEFLVPNPEFFADYVFTEYLSQLKKCVKLKTHNEENSSIVDVIIGDEQYTINAREQLAMDENEDILIHDNAMFGGIVYFKVKDGKLIGEFALSLAINDYVSPMYIGKVITDIDYNKGKFMLSNFRFETNK